MRLFGQWSSARIFRFQSTHPSGVRLGHLVNNRDVNEISIHAPQWGATSTTCSVSIEPSYFNPRTPVGCDTTPNVLGSRTCSFQSTHPSGVRPATQYRLGVRSLFQSTHPSGVRLSCTCLQYPVLSIFQSTHPSGVRPTEYKTLARKSQFQSTHPSGVRLKFGDSDVRRGLISIHAPQWGATVSPATRGKLFTYFNPRTPVGCDRFRVPVSDCFTYFNPRTPVGCDEMQADNQRLWQ